MVVKSLFALLCAPDLDAVFDEPFHHERRFVGNPANAVEHLDQQNVKFFFSARSLMFCSLSRFSAHTLWPEIPSSCFSCTIFQPMQSANLWQTFFCKGMSASWLLLQSTCFPVETRYRQQTRLLIRLPPLAFSPYYTELGRPVECASHQVGFPLGRGWLPRLSTSFFVR